MKTETKNVKLAYDFGFCQSIHFKLSTECAHAWEDCNSPSWAADCDYRLAGRPTFDLGRAASQQGAKFCTRDGRDAKFIIYADEAFKEKYPVIVMVGGEVFQFARTGYYHIDGDSDMDLFMLPNMRTYWVNLYANGISRHFESEALAAADDANQSAFRVGRKAWPVEVMQAD